MMMVRDLMAELETGDRTTEFLDKKPSYGQFTTMTVLSSGATWIANTPLTQRAGLSGYANQTNIYGVGGIL